MPPPRPTWRTRIRKRPSTAATLKTRPTSIDVHVGHLSFRIGDLSFGDLTRVATFNHRMTNPQSPMINVPRVPAISAQSISHRYGERQALDGVTFTVAE